MTNKQTNTNSQAGFTLVELAIVMVIIGLLIGGILKGQELIANAKISSSISQLKSTDAALNTFQDKFNALPGDMVTPGTRLPGCIAAPCTTAGDGDQTIDAPAFGAAPANNNEAGVLFTHLSASDLVSGIDASGSSATFGRMLPTLKAAGGFWISYATAAIASTGVTTGKHYAILNGTAGATSATSGAISPVIAAQIDRKLDDGIPTTGGFSGIGTGCTTGTPVVYAEAAGTGTCVGYFRILN